MATVQAGLRRWDWLYSSIEEWPFRRWPRRSRIRLVLITTLAAIIVLSLTPQTILGASYHDFADKRRLIGVANCLNVLSNIPFIIVGLWGVWWLRPGSTIQSFAQPVERVPYLVFFVGVFLTGAGSFWYHLSPANSRLPWDLLPMTSSYMSMTAAVIVERIDTKAGLWLLGPLVAIGAASVALWYLGDMYGQGDYGFYLFVQFFPPVLLVLVVALFPPRYTRTDLLIAAFALFVLAKTFELFDARIYAFTGMISGHSLKHVTAAISCYWILKMLKQRRACTSNRACFVNYAHHGA